MGKDLSRYGDITNFPCSLVMSGVESDAYFDIAIGEGIDRMLMSYLYIQRKGKGFIRDRLSKHPNVKLMIDSGAHTFHAKEEEYKNKPLEFWEKYIEKYTNFIKANKEFIFSCVELDIANLIGFDKVDYFREKYFEPLKDEGILVCYVWHDYDGDKHWEEMCSKYDYVGFSLVNTTMTEKDIVKKMNIARRYGCLVHGFAVTRVDIMSKVPFFTGDSTTWLVGTQYGELNWFDGRKMRRLKKEKWKFEYKQKYIKLGAKPDLFMDENPYELIRINLIVFKQAEEYIRKRIRGKSYWFNATKAVQKVASLRPTKKKEEVPLVKKKVIIKKKKKATETVGDNFREVSKEEVVQHVESIPSAPPTKFETFQALSNKQEEEVRDLDEQVDLLPDLDWFDGDMSDWKDIVYRLGFNTNGQAEDAVIDNLYNICLFIRDIELLDDIDDEQIENVVKFYCGKTFESREENIENCTEIIRKNLCLEVNTLFPKETSSMDMEATERPKEREEYLVDEEYEYVDISDAEMANYLPAPEDDMPEVHELDAELNKSGIIAVRDEKGRFLKGQKRVRKPKQIYSDKFPKLACNTCYKAGDCPEFQPDAVCAFDKIFNKFDVRNFDDVMDAMQGMVNLNLGRMQRQAMFETMDGGMADGVVTSMIDQNVNLLLKMKQMHEQQSQIVATQRRTLRSDGSSEETTTVMNPSNGILAQIFGTPSSNDREMEEDIIDAEMEEIKD